MLLWIAFALLTAAVLVAVVAPLARPGREETEPVSDAGTLAVYRDQLEEVEAERARGLLEPAEAEGAKLEISRRLLASAARSEIATAAASPRALLESRHANIALVVALAVPALTLALYLASWLAGHPVQPLCRAHRRRHRPGTARQA